MSGFFYAFEDAAECGQELPGVWDGDSLIPTVLLRSTRGVWLVPPLLEVPEDDLAEMPYPPGTRSEDFVILSRDEYPDASAFRIYPVAEQGFM